MRQLLLLIGRQERNLIYLAEIGLERALDCISAMATNTGHEDPRCVGRNPGPLTSINRVEFSPSEGLMHSRPAVIRPARVKKPGVIRRGFLPPSGSTVRVLPADSRSTSDGRSLAHDYSEAKPLDSRRRVRRATQPGTDSFPQPALSSWTPYSPLSLPLPYTYRTTRFDNLRRIWKSRKYRDYAKTSNSVDLTCHEERSRCGDRTVSIREVDSWDGKEEHSVMV